MAGRDYQFFNMEGQSTMQESADNAAGLVGVDMEEGEPQDDQAELIPGKRQNKELREYC